MNLRILAAAGAAVLFSAGVAMAQGTTTSSAPTTPAVTHSSTATSSTAHAATTHTTATGGAVSCRSSHAVGSSCGCRKAPGRHGTVQAGANGGHAMCSVPAAAAATHG